MMDLTRIGIFFELLERELAGQPDLHADLMAVVQFEPQLLMPWLAVIDMAETKLGDLDTVVKWITCPHLELNGVSPASLVGSSDGVARVSQLLTQYAPLPPWRTPLDAAAQS
ncbi:antitoxin Xre/MbcA/ParS toxin-binding domain-containing protein [uncultured Deefgea sp.]|uniref:antitoxin Xre/MbcA/ParS toxin-binding domain-containing protein n=1 Tax=uncultured Deefgea sp. TaxID=1304914 RepID=UPI0025917C72|nr:antitoxin Xre/MbcA/ParS toxin-binding domain-containing protein [uncultured Deefgea sp.]